MILRSVLQRDFEKAAVSRAPKHPDVPDSLSPFSWAHSEGQDGFAVSGCMVAGENGAHRALCEAEVERSKIVNARFAGADFTNSVFSDVVLEGCDFSNAVFDQAGFKRCAFRDCKMTGASFLASSFEHVLIDRCSCSYAGFGHARWNTVRIAQSDLSHADLSYMDIRQVGLDGNIFIGTGFFQTKLLGVDFTSSRLEGAVFSDDLHEVYGTKLTIYQAASLTKNFGVIMEE